MFHKVQSNNPHSPRPFLLLALLSAFPPLSTDMYLPAIPLLQKTWQQPLPIVNLTLVGFFISYCVCLLFYGPLADRFGRRPPLLGGIALFIAASLLCAISNNVVTLIVFRVLQGAGSFACTRLLGTVGSMHILSVGFAGIALGGGMMAFRWIPGAWGLAIPMSVISFSFGLSRPPSNNIVLEQVDCHAGAASSLLIFIYFLLGALSMWLISLEWADKILFIGLLGLVSGGILFVIWMVLSWKPFSVGKAREGRQKLAR